MANRSSPNPKAHPILFEAPQFERISEKTVFVTKESPEPIQQLPLAAFKDTMKGVFKHYRQCDDIVQRTGECVTQESEKDGVKQKMATSSRLNQLIEFMKCFPILVKRDKNNSSGMDFVMQKNQEPNQTGAAQVN